MSPKKGSKGGNKRGNKRKNQSKNISGESLNKILLSDTLMDNTNTIPRLTSVPPQAFNMDFAHSTPHTPNQYVQQGQFSPYQTGVNKGQVPDYVSPIPLPSHPVSMQSIQNAPSDLHVLISNLSKKMDTMCTKLNKLDLIEERLLKMEQTMVSVTGDLKGVQTKIKEMDEGLSMINKICEENKSEVGKMKKTVKEISDSSQEVKNESKASKEHIEFLESELAELKERHLDLQTRSMRENLIFDGIPEVPDEDAEETVKRFIGDELGLTDEYKFDRVHRLGRHTPGKHRQIIAKFSSFKDKEAVRKAAPRLKGKPYGLNEQFPKEIVERRKTLIPHLKAAKQQNKKAVLKVDKLFIDNRPFRPDASRERRFDRRAPDRGNATNNR
ncbi:hypothetical protein FSP39_016437 [Pinctada imbricata]|uniref:Uncharacterized protein n=1 Tax=Pinctada imbricata TaxID=66713 RepID=A0AA88YD47_PINIB|nr:hypothetical protein FSP39_016437 [Pinctada imbricata]